MTLPEALADLARCTCRDCVGAAPNCPAEVTLRVELTVEAHAAWSRCRCADCIVRALRCERFECPALRRLALLTPGEAEVDA